MQRHRRAAARVARSVTPLVHLVGDDADRRTEAGDALDAADGVVRMLPDHQPLVVRQGTLRQANIAWHAQHADIMEQRAQPHVKHLGPIATELRDDRHAKQRDVDAVVEQVLMV